MTSVPARSYHTHRRGYSFENSGLPGAELVELGDKMATLIAQLRESTVHKLRVKGIKAP